MKHSKNPIKNDFPWFKNNPKLFYFDNAATSLKPQIMVDKIMEYYSSTTCNPHNVDSSFTFSLGSKIEKTRDQLAKFLNSSPNEIIFTSGATESLNLFANGLKSLIKPKSEIILTTIEHSSNIVPWFNLASEKAVDIKFVGQGHFPTEPEIIAEVNLNTSIVSVCSSSNLFGYKLNIERLSSEIKKINPKTIIIVDATQTLPHEKIDIKKWDIDFLAASAHKMCGPTGIGLAYINSRWLKKMSPIRFGGGMNNILNLKEFSYSSGPSKFEGGTPNVAGIIGWSAALEYLEQIGWDKITDHSYKLKKYLDEQLRLVDNLRNYSEFTPYPVISFNIKGVHSQDLANYLWTNKMIVRSGLSCAKNAGLTIDEESVVRASFYIYNDEKDVDYFVDILKKYRRGKELDGVI